MRFRVGDVASPAGAAKVEVDAFAVARVTVHDVEECEVDGGDVDAGLLLSFAAHSLFKRLPAVVMTCGKTPKAVHIAGVLTLQE